MEEIKVAGSKLKSTIKNLIREGNVRRIIVRNGEGRTLLDMPLTAGVAGVVTAKAIDGRADTVTLGCWI